MNKLPLLDSLLFSIKIEGC